MLHRSLCLLETLNLGNKRSSEGDLSVERREEGVDEGPGGFRMNQTLDGPPRLTKKGRDPFPPDDHRQSFTLFEKRDLRFLNAKGKIFR